MSQLPHIFGRGLRERLLMTLAVNDRSLYIAELSANLKSDTRKVRDTLLPLLTCRVIGCSRGLDHARYVGLNPGFPAYMQLLRLLRVMEARWPQPRLGKPARRAERIGLRNIVIFDDAAGIASMSLDTLFSTSVRTRSLLAIAAFGETDVSDLVRTLGLDNRSVWNVVNHWQREGIIESVVSGRRRVIRLDRTYPMATEMRRFLRRIVTVTEEYEALATLSSRRVGSPRFVALR